MYIIDAMVKKFGASMGCPRCVGRARSAAWRRAADRQGPEVGGENEAMMIEEEVPPTTLASSSRQQEQGCIVRRIMGLETQTAEEEPCAEEVEQPGAEEAVERKRQFEALRQQMLEVGEVLAAPALEVSSQQCWCTGDPQAVEAAGAARGASCCRAISPLEGARRIRSKWLDYYTAGGAEVKSRLVATEVACGNRDDCFAEVLQLKDLHLMVSLPASRGRDSRSSTSRRRLCTP